MNVLSKYLTLQSLKEPTSYVDYQLQKRLEINPKRDIGHCGKTVIETNKIITNNVVILEGIAMAAMARPPKELSMFLMDSIYVILEKYGDSNHSVHMAALNALQCLAHGCLKESNDPITQNPLVNLKDSIPSPANLVLLHVDYLIDSVSHRLRHLTKNPMAPKVLVAAIKITGVEIIGQIGDSVDQIIDILGELGTSGFVDKIGITENVNEDQSGIVYELLKVFHSLLQVMLDDHLKSRLGVKLISDNNETLIQNIGKIHHDFEGLSPEMTEFLIKNQNDDDKNYDNGEHLKSSKEFFSERISNITENKKNNEDIFGDIDDPESSANIMASNQDENKEPTLTESLALKILNHCLYFLSSDSSHIRKMVLQMFQMGLVVLEGSPLLLNPLVHTLWPTLILRCQDSRHYVAIDALCLIKIIAETSQGFIRKRVEDNIISAFIVLFKNLQRIVEKSKLTNAQKSTNSSIISRNKMHYFISPLIETHSTDNICLKTLFETLLSIIDYVPMSSSNADEISEIMVKFLDSSMYSQIVCQDSIKVLQFIVKKRGSQWICVLIWSALGSPTITSPHPKFIPLIASKSFEIRANAPKFDNYAAVLNHTGNFGHLITMSYMRCYSKEK
jgi:predicted CopG family antitoxin